MQTQKQLRSHKGNKITVQTEAPTTKNAKFRRLRKRTLVSTLVLLVVLLGAAAGSAV
jgi:hypothetical protein